MLIWHPQASDAGPLLKGCWDDWVCCCCSNVSILNQIAIKTQRVLRTTLSCSSDPPGRPQNRTGTLQQYVTQWGKKKKTLFDLSAPKCAVLGPGTILQKVFFILG